MTLTIQIKSVTRVLFKRTSSLDRTGSPQKNHQSQYERDHFT